MGMFDSIYLEVKCPKCGETSEMECQTKDLDCNLDVYRVGDDIGTDKYNYLDCNASCKSTSCMEYEEREIKYRLGFGYIFYIKIKILDGVVTNEYKII
jgi:hypothetical protein